MLHQRRPTSFASFLYNNQALLGPEPYGRQGLKFVNTFGTVLKADGTYDATELHSVMDAAEAGGYHLCHDGEAFWDPFPQLYGSLRGWNPAPSDVTLDARRDTWKAMIADARAYNPRILHGGYIYPHYIGDANAYIEPYLARRADIRAVTARFHETAGGASDPLPFDFACPQAPSWWFGNTRAAVAGCIEDCRLAGALGRPVFAFLSFTNYGGSVLTPSRMRIVAEAARRADGIMWYGGWGAAWPWARFEQDVGSSMAAWNAVTNGSITIRLGHYWTRTYTGLDFSAAGTLQEVGDVICDAVNAQVAATVFGTEANPTHPGTLSCVATVKALHFTLTPHPTQGFRIPPDIAILSTEVYFSGGGSGTELWGVADFFAGTGTAVVSVSSDFPLEDGWWWGSSLPHSFAQVTTRMNRTRGPRRIYGRGGGALGRGRAAVPSSGGGTVK